MSKSKELGDNKNIGKKPTPNLKLKCFKSKISQSLNNENGKCY